LLGPQNLAAELAELFGAEDAAQFVANYALLNLCSNHKGSRKVGSGSSEFVGGHLLVMRYLIVSLTIYLIQATEVLAQGVFPAPLPGRVAANDPAFPPVPGRAGTRTDPAFPPVPGQTVIRNDPAFPPVNFIHCGDLQ
jgi:hypothetical protein